MRGLWRITAVLAVVVDPAPGVAMGPCLNGIPVEVPAFHVEPVQLFLERLFGLQGRLIEELARLSKQADVVVKEAALGPSRPRALAGCESIVGAETLLRHPVSDSEPVPAPQLPRAWTELGLLGVEVHHLHDGSPFVNEVDMALEYVAFLQLSTGERFASGQGYDCWGGGFICQSSAFPRHRWVLTNMLAGDGVQVV